MLEESTLAQKDSESSYLHFNTPQEEEPNKWITKVEEKRNQICSIMIALMASESSRKEQHYPSEYLSTVMNTIKLRCEDLVSTIKISPIPSPHKSPSPAADISPKLYSLQDNLADSPRFSIESVGEMLENNQNFPWDEFRLLEDSDMVELLANLQRTAEVKLANHPALIIQMMNFALKITQICEMSKNEIKTFINLKKDVLNILGQLIYLVDKKPNKIIGCLTSNVYFKIISNIKAEFSIHLNKICTKLDSYYKDQLLTGLQSPELSLATQVPIEIAKFLITERGTVNFGLVDLFLEIFVKDRANTSQLNYALELMRDSPKLRKEIEDIKPPKSSKSPIRDVIRTPLALDENAIITNYESKINLVAAYMSEIRQTDQTSCFVSSLVRELQSFHLIFSTKDLRELLEKSRISRKVGGVRKEIIFVKKIFDNDLNLIVFLDKKGKFKNKKTKLPLWRAPGIIAVCEVLGIKDSKMAIKKIISELDFTKTIYHEITVKLILNKICEYALTQNPTGKKLADLISQAYFTFSSQTTNSLSRVWVNAIGNLAELEESGVIKKTIVGAIEKTISRKLAKFPQSNFISIYIATLRKYFLAKIELRFDPAIEKNNDNRKCSGGFALFVNGCQIDDHQDFQKFIIDTLSHVAYKLSAVNTVDKGHSELESILEVLNPFTSSIEMLNEVVLRFHPENIRKYIKSNLSVSLPYEEMPTPWLIIMGNNSKILMNNYFENHEDIKVESIVFNNAREALSHIISLPTKLSQNQKELLLNYPNILKALCVTGKHRLSLTLGNKSLARIWEEGNTIDWVEKTLLNPVKEIINQRFSTEMRKDLIQNLKLKLFSQYYNEQQSETLIEILNNDNAPQTISKFRNYTITLCQKLNELSKIHYDIPLMVRQLDTIIYKSLPKETKDIYKKSNIHFASTAWANELHKIDLTFMVNPGNRLLEIWEVQENGKKMIAADQKFWLGNQTWEFIEIPEHLLPADRQSLT